MHIISSGVLFSVVDLPGISLGLTTGRVQIIVVHLLWISLRRPTRGVATSEPCARTQCILPCCCHTYCYYYVSSFCDPAALSALSISTNYPSALASIATPHIWHSSPPSPSARNNKNHAIFSTQSQPSSPMALPTLHSLHRRRPWWGALTRTPGISIF